MTKKTDTEPFSTLSLRVTQYNVIKNFNLQRISLCMFHGETILCLLKFGIFVEVLNPLKYHHTYSTDKSLQYFLENDRY